MCVTPSNSSSRELSYLWIAEPEVQTAEVGEEAEASEENPVLETGNKQVSKNNRDGWMDGQHLTSIHTVSVKECNGPALLRGL